ncbi:MAG: hypothetical protein [Podoviridae sp. ctbj_2]|nr:MAG: hypothetical protein [Podoviridae sp. ctbj_2]
MIAFFARHVVMLVFPLQNVFHNSSCLDGPMGNTSENKHRLFFLVHVHFCIRLPILHGVNLFTLDSDNLAHIGSDDSIPLFVHPQQNGCNEASE